MEQLHQAAVIYHDVSPNQTKELAQVLFNCVNTAAGGEKAELREFLSFTTADNSTQINNRPLLKDGSTGGGGGVYCSIM